MPDTRPYETHFRAYYTADTLSAELMCWFTWFAENAPTCAISTAVAHATRVTKAIQPLIDAAKQTDAQVKINVRLMEIYDCVAESFKYQSTPFQLALAERIVADSEEAAGDAQEPVSDTLLAIYGYVAHTQATLTGAQRRSNAKHIFSALEPYFLAAERNPFARKCTIERVGLYLWCQRQHPALAIDKAVSWCADINRSTRYRCTRGLFPSSYPFSCLEFTSHTTQTATLCISVRTYLSLPLITSLSRLPNARVGENNVSIAFDLKANISSEQVLVTATRCLEIIEHQLLPADASSQLFYYHKPRFSNAFREFIQDAKVGFPGLKCLAFSPPVDQPTNTSHPSCTEISHSVTTLDYARLHAYLRAGGDPNVYHYCRSLLDRVVKQVEDITCYLMCGAPEGDNLGVLNRPYTVIIAKIEGNYFLYYKPSDTATVVKQAITSTKDRQFLKSLEEKWFRAGRPGKTNVINENRRLHDVVAPYVATTIGQQRQQEAEKRYAIASLLLEYQANPRCKFNPNHPGATTALEQLVESTHHSPLDALNQQLFRRFIKLLFRSDQGCSHLNVASEYGNHFLGALIITGQRSHYLTGKIPPSIRAIHPVSTRTTTQLCITHQGGQQLFLEALPLASLPRQDKKQIVALCKRQFPWKNKLSEAAFEAYIQKKLVPGKHIAIIDLLRNGLGNIVGFNIAELQIPLQREQSILHYIRLAASETSLRTHFKKVMSVVSFQRILFMRHYTQRNVLTTYTTASVSSYLQLSGLIFYPKYRCLAQGEQQRLQTTFYADRVVKDGCYLPSKLYYHATPQRKSFLGRSDVDAQAYTTRIERPDHSLLVAFHATATNMAILSAKVQPYLPRQCSLFKVAEKAAPLTQPYLGRAHTNGLRAKL